MEEQYANTTGPKDGHVLSLEELLAYVKAPGDIDLTPYADLLHQLEAMGDPGMPSREHAIVLRWVGEALYHYEQRFPLEEPLASTIRRLKPLAACIALTEPDFMQPDVHPLHQFLDAIQTRSVGWQSSLGRTGANLQNQVEGAVEEALQWFEDDSTNIATICSEFLETAERDNARAGKMCQRVIDTESGKSRTAAARTEATRLINGLLDKSLLPREIGEFIKGPWYDSAQLLLLKFGADSDQWREMSSTTHALLQSVQSLEGADDDRRQEVAALIARLPKDMRRWLLSLHHDTPAVNDAMATLESVHMRIMRGQALELFRVEPINATRLRGVQSQPLADSLDFLEQWHWFAIDTYNGGTIRAQLIYKNNNEQRLVFANLAGIKVLEYSFAEFDQLMSRKRVTALPTGAAFSLCLVLSAGVDTTDKLDALYSEVARHSDPQAKRKAAAARGSAEHGGVQQPDLTPEEERGLHSLIENPSPTRADTPGDVQGAPAAEMGVEELSGIVPAQTKSAAADGADSTARPAPGSSGGGYFGGGDETADSGGGYFGGAASNDEQPVAPVRGEDGKIRQAALPMGTWLNFREDGEPVDGELQAYDPQTDIHTFHSHGGRVIRELTTGQLHSLVSEGLVEAL
ncbi:MAG: hypothetical protein Hals2KO_13630 [Halioglobus sp.]